MNEVERSRPMRFPKSYTKAQYKVIEQDLYNLKLMKQQIENVMKELDETEFTPGLQSMVWKDTVSFGSGTSDPTFNQALRAISLKDRFKKVMAVYSAIGFCEMCRRVDAIEDVLERLRVSSIGMDRLKVDVIQKRYFERRLTPDGIAMEMNISRATVYRWCDDVIEEIATKLGFII